MGDILIQNTDVLRVDAKGVSAEILHGQDVLIAGKHINTVQPTDNADLAMFETVIDGNGKLTMPGLINCHAHVPMVLWRGLAEDASIDRWFNDLMWPLENNLEPEDVYWGDAAGAD